MTAPLAPRPAPRANPLRTADADAVIAGAERPDTFTRGSSGAPFVQPPATAPASGGMSALNVRLQDPSAYSLPSEVSLGAATIHRYDDPRVVPSTIAVTVWVPLGIDGHPGQVKDMADMSFTDRLPERFILSDAGLTRCFLGVDRRKGTPLDQKLDAIIAQIPTQPDGSRTLDATVEWLRTNVNKLIKWTAGSSANDGRAEFAWDKAINVDRKVWDTFSSVAFHPAGHDPVDSGVDYPVVPFEKYLDAGEGYCIQKAVLAALVLDKLGFNYRLVNGAVAQGPGRTTGHTWLQLEDGRVFDPAWSMVAQPVASADARFPHNFRFGSSERFENQNFPYLEW